MHVISVLGGAVPRLKEGGMQDLITRHGGFNSATIMYHLLGMLPKEQRCFGRNDLVETEYLHTARS